MEKILFKSQLLSIVSERIMLLVLTADNINLKLKFITEIDSI